jgi:hypothetical protein
MNVMRTLRPRDGLDASAPRTAESSSPVRPITARSHLQLIVDNSEPPSPLAEPTGATTFGLIQYHLSLARRLGVTPLTVAERATSLLEGACSGWRNDGQCTTGRTTPLEQPHARCVRAQYHHDLLLLEHGLLRSRIDDDSTDRDAENCAGAAAGATFSEHTR